MALQWNAQEQEVMSGKRWVSLHAAPRTQVPSPGTFSKATSPRSILPTVPRPPLRRTFLLWGANKIHPSHELAQVARDRPCVLGLCHCDLYWKGGREPGKATGVPTSCLLLQNGDQHLSFGHRSSPHADTNDPRVSKPVPRSQHRGRGFV